MADAADEGSALADVFNAAALANLQASQSQEKRTICVDCGGKIEAQRLTLLSVLRCRECQHEHDWLKQRGGV